MAFRQVFSLRNTIFIRLIGTFMLIMVPIILLGIYLYHWSIRTASEDISKTGVSQISFYLNDLSNEIDRMKLLEYGMLDDTDLNKLAITWETMNDIERMDKITSVFNRVISIQNSSEYIRNISVHIRPISKTISALNGASGFDEKRYRAIRAEFGQHGTRLAPSNGELYISAAKPSGSNGKDPLFVIEIELDSRKLRQALMQFNTYPDSSTLLASGDSGFVLSSGSGGALGVGEQELSREAMRLGASASNALTIGGQSYFVSQAYSETLDMSIYRFIPEAIVRRPLDKFYTWAWLFVAISLVVIVVYALSTYKFIHKPLLKLVKGFRRLEHGDMELTIGHEANDEFRYIYARFNQMVVNLRALIDQVYKHKIMSQKAELKQLQSQINPHFLYNSFFILNTLAKTGDTERIEQFTTLLGEYFRFVTRNSSDEVTLGQEISHARMYADIQEMRFSRRIQVRFDELPAAFENVRVPRLIVQPIIENAFEHSLEKMARNGWMSVSFALEDGFVCIGVEDNGSSLSDDDIEKLSRSILQEEEGAETTAIVNIHRRIVIIHGEGSGLRMARGQHGGLKVTIRLPFKEGDNDV